MTTNTENGQATERASAACPLCRSNFDGLLLELLRTWRDLWRLLGQLQHAHHAARHDTPGVLPIVTVPNTAAATNRGMNTDTNMPPSSSCPCVAREQARTRRAFLAMPVLPTMPENHEDYDCE